MKPLSDLKATVGRGRVAMNVLRLAANVADGETITIGGVVFEFDNNATYTAGNIPITVTTLTPTAVAPLIVSAINANTPYLATAISVNEILVVGKDGTAPIGAVACTETMAGSGNAWSAATMNAGAADGTVALALQQRAAVAQDVTIGHMLFPFPFTVAAVQVNVRTSAGVAKAWDGAVTFSGGVVTVDNSGTTDFAATDVVAVLASS
jgi:hypothetical protein